MTVLSPTTPPIPTAYAPVVRNGVTAPYQSTVIERVYLPPEGSGGRSVTRFSILAWSDADIMYHRRLVVMLGTDSVAPIRIPSVRATGDYRARAAFTMAADERD